MTSREIRKLFAEYKRIRDLNYRSGFTDEDYPRSRGPLDRLSGLSREQVMGALQEEREYRAIAKKYAEFEQFAARSEKGQRYVDSMFALRSRLDEWVKNCPIRRSDRVPEQ